MSFKIRLYNPNLDSVKKIRNRIDQFINFIKDEIYNFLYFSPKSLVMPWMFSEI